MGRDDEVELVVDDDTGCLGVVALVGAVDEVSNFVDLFVL